MIFIAGAASLKARDISVIRRSSMQRTTAMKDYLEDEVDEKYYINSEKAQKLIKDLRESGQLDGISKTVRGAEAQ